MPKSVARFFMFAVSIGALAQTQPGDLSRLDVDDLMNVEVTSVARRAQKLADTPAAVFVITREDIERSGATTIAEVLRMAPGLDVASIDGNIWAISVRGFNAVFRFQVSGFRFLVLPTLHPAKTAPESASPPP